MSNNNNVKNTIGTVIGDDYCVVWVIPSFDVLFREKDNRIYSPSSYGLLQTYVYRLTHSQLYLLNIGRRWQKESSSKWKTLIIHSENNKGPAFKNIRFGFVNMKNETKYYNGDWIEESIKYFVIREFTEKTIFCNEIISGLTGFAELNGHLFCEIASNRVSNVVSTQTENEDGKYFK